MRKEFWYWIISAIEGRCKDLGKPLVVAQRQDLLREIQKFSNDDYENVSNCLTSAIEDKLLLYGIGTNDAIRISWKWSD